MYTSKFKHQVLAASNSYPLLHQRYRGIEKESLRITTDGRLAKTPHPKALGSALTNSAITTDFSESLLEFITKPHSSIKDALSELTDIHHFVYQNLDAEILWVASMPCKLGDASAIPLAQYGSSNVAKMKNIYRRGLSNRYGSAMQTIAGIHFNFSLTDEFFSKFSVLLGSEKSLQDFKTERYFSIIRNFHRLSWLLVYLLGASPAFAKSFIDSTQEHGLETTQQDDLLGPYATSLRMGDLGYTSRAQDGLFVCYNELESYIDTLLASLTKVHAPFEAMGVRSEDGEYKQLSAAILQIENEYYSTIRPKRTTKTGETPIKALAERGVEYIEVRCLDLDPDSPIGTNESDLEFLELFIVHCLLDDDYVCNQESLFEGRENLKRVIERGRMRDLVLSNNGNDILMVDWANDIFDRINETAAALGYVEGDEMLKLIARYRRLLQNPEATPSGKLAAELLSREDASYNELMLEKSVKTAEFFKSQSLKPDLNSTYVEAAKQSFQQQQAIEDSDSISFDEYLANYYAQYRELEALA